MNSYSWRMAKRYRRADARLLLKVREPSTKGTASNMSNESLTDIFESDDVDGASTSPFSPTDRELVSTTTRSGRTCQA